MSSTPHRTQFGSTSCSPTGRPSWMQRHRHPKGFGLHGVVLLAHGLFEEAIWPTFLVLLIGSSGTQARGA